MASEASEPTPDEQALGRALGGPIDPAVRDRVRAAFLEGGAPSEKGLSARKSPSPGDSCGRNADRPNYPTRSEGAPNPAPRPATRPATRPMSIPLDPAAAELREALTSDSAAASFKAGLRASFTGGALGATPNGASPAGASPAGASPAGASPAGASPRGASSLGAAHSPDEESPDVRLQRALSGSAPRAAFRKELLNGFVTGELASEGDAAPIPQHPSTQRLRLLGYVAPLVAAAALALIFLPGLLRQLQPVPEWRILRGQEARFENGLVEASDAPVRLELGGGAFMQLQPEAEAQLPEPCWLKGNCLDVPIRLEGLAEAILFAGNEEQDVSMKVETEEAEMELSGSVASVLPCDGGTCIVIGAGSAIVRSRVTGEQLTLQAGDRVFVPAMGKIEITRGFVDQLDRPEVRARILNLQAAQADMAAEVF